MTKIWTLSDQPFSFPSKSVIFVVEIMKCLIPAQNFGIFASPTKGMDTFLFEMGIKWMFTLKNFRNVYWHGKQHSALIGSSGYLWIYWKLFRSKDPGPFSPLAILRIPVSNMTINERKESESRILHFDTGKYIWNIWTMIKWGAHLKNLYEIFGGR